MFKSTESTASSILPEADSILAETLESELGDHKKVENQNSPSAMQPKVDETPDLPVPVKVGGSAAVDIRATLSEVTVSEELSNHGMIVKPIQNQSSDCDIAESGEEKLQAGCDRSEMELPLESTESTNSPEQIEKEMNGQLTAPFEMEFIQPTSSNAEATSPELGANDNILKEDKMDTHDNFGSLDHHSISGMEEYSLPNKNVSETGDIVSGSEKDEKISCEDIPISSLNLNLREEDSQNFVENETSTLLNNECESKVDDYSVFSKNITSKNEESLSRRNSENEDKHVDKIPGAVDFVQREKASEEFSKEILENTSESYQVSGTAESSSKDPETVKYGGNECVSTDAGKLADVNDCVNDLSSCAGKEPTETEGDGEKEEGELEEGELDDDNEEERNDLPDNQTGPAASAGSVSDEDQHDGKKVCDSDEKKRKKKLDTEEEPKKKKKKIGHFYEEASDDFHKHVDFDTMLAQYRRKAAGEEDEQSYKEPGYDELGRHKRRLEGRPPLLPHSKAEALCVPFLEGTCNKGNECQYSHNMNHSIIMQPHQRKMELCKFYQMGCCAKKQKCSYMHKDFPCKLYHTGMKCVPSDKCQYSHEPLTHITKSILLKHIEMAPKDILGTFPRLSNTAAQQIIAVTELCRNKRPCDIDAIPGIRDWRGKGFKYVDRAIRSFDRKSRRIHAESAAEDEPMADHSGDRPSLPKEGSLSPGHQDLAKSASHREHRPRSGAETEEGSGDEDRKYGRNRKRHRSYCREDEEPFSQGRSESFRHHKHRNDGRSSKHDDRRRHRMTDHYSKRDEPRLDEPCGRSAARFDYGGRDEPRMDDSFGRSGSRRRASRWGDDREEAGGSSLSPGSSPNAHRHGGGRGRADFPDTGEGYGKHSQRRMERDRHSSRERRAWPTSDDDDGRRNRRHGDSGMPPSPRDHRESSEDDEFNAAIAATVDSIPSMLDSFKRSSSSHQDQNQNVRASDIMYSDSSRGSDRLTDRNFPLDHPSSRMTNPNSDRFSASEGDKNDEPRSSTNFQGRYDPLEIFRRQQMQESASTREVPILGQTSDGTVEYSPYLKNFKKVPPASISPTSQHYPSGTSGTSSFEASSQDRDATDPKRDAAGSSGKEYRRTPPRSEEEERSTSMVLKLNLSNINVPSDLAQVLSSLKSQTRLAKSDSAPVSVASQSPASKVSPPRREDFGGLRDSPTSQNSPYLKSFRSWSPSGSNQIPKDQPMPASDPRQRMSSEDDAFETKRSDSMPSNFYEALEGRSNTEPSISAPRRGVKDQTLSHFRDPRLTRAFPSLDQSSRSARLSGDSDDRSNDQELEVDLKRLQSSSSTGSFKSEIPFEIPHHEPVTVINASITTSPPMVYRLVEVTVPKVNLDSIKNRFDRDHPRVHEDPRLFKIFFNPDSSSSRSPSSIVYEDPQSPPPAEASPSQSNLESRDPRIKRDPRVAESRNVDPRINTDPRINSDPRRNLEVRGNSDPRNRNLSGSIPAPDLDVRLSGDESQDFPGGGPRLGGHADPRLENRRSDPRLNNRDPRANRSFDESNLTNNPMGEAYVPGLLGNAPGPMVPFGGPAMGGSSSMGLLNGPPGMPGHMPMPMGGPMSNMYPQNMMNHPSQPPDMMHKMPHNMGPVDMNPYSSRYGGGPPHGPSLMGRGVNDPSLPPPNNLGSGLGLNSSMGPHSLQGNWPPTSSFQNNDPRLKKN